MRIRSLQIIVINLVILFSLRFFDLKFLNGDLFKYIQFLFLAIVFISSAQYFLKFKGGFVVPIQLIVFSMFISVFVNYFTWGQSMFDSLVVLMPYTVWIFFFLLLYHRVNPLKLEKIVVTYGVLYVILYLYQITNYNNVYFGWQEKIGLSRGVLRIIFPGGGVFYLMSFIALCRIKTSSKNKWFWIVLTTLGLIMPILQVTRQSIAAVLFIYLLHFFKKYSMLAKLIGVVVVIISYFFIVNTDNIIVKGLTSDMERDIELGEDYVRAQAASYYISEFSPTIANNLLGNGVARPSTAFGNKVNGLEENEGFYIVDIGIIGFYTLFGAFVVISYIMIWYKSITIKLPSRFSYLKYYLWFLLITSLTSDFTFGNSYLVTTVLVLYMYHYIHVINTKKTLIKIK
jgi:hypothetical protein